jgi:hypothetical protein
MRQRPPQSQCMKVLFPSALMLLDLGAAFVYGINTDWKHSIYWIAAATLTACVTF